MKFRSRTYLEDREGEERVVNKFLLIPRRFEGKEWRWMERADIVERITRVEAGGSYQWEYYVWKWVEVGFAKIREKEDVWYEENK